MDGQEAINALLKLLDAEDDDKFKLAVLEAINTLALMIHHLRGRMSWLTYTRAVEFPTLEQQAQYDRMNELIEQLEPVVWDIAPPRALLMEMAKFRETGELDDSYVYLFSKDEVGRIPEIPGVEVEDTQIEEVLNRLKDYRRFKGGSTAQGS